MDEHQWYPPVFPLLLARIPESLFDRFCHTFSVLIDGLRLILLLGVASWLSQGSVYAIVAAGLVYATVPILNTYNIQLNPRGLGALFLDGLMALWLWLFQFNGPVWIWVGIILLSGLILLTHKMTTQIFWFLCLGAGILTGDWRFLAMIPVSVLAALLLSKGFYWNVMRAHWDIVSFWHRNWRWLQAHPVKESPIYGDPGYETPTKFYRKGLTGNVKHIVSLFALNPMAWSLLGFLAVLFFRSLRLEAAESFFLWSALLTILFVLLTAFVNVFKGLGAAYLYLYNISFPVAVLWGLTLSRNKADAVGWLLFGAGLGSCLLALYFFYRKIIRSKTLAADVHLEAVFADLKQAPKGVVLCLPQQWYDVIAYKTDQSVLYGGHGYGFKRLEPLFPRFLLSVGDIVRKYHVRYIVALDGYLPSHFIEEIPYNLIKEYGPYRIYEIS
ncbi:MAG: hypothetical protein ABSF88_12410 [Candidatus Aminicenantales bacterium]